MRPAGNLAKLYTGSPIRFIGRNRKTKDHIVLKTNRLVANRWGKYGGGFVFRLFLPPLLHFLPGRSLFFQG
ncbi:hypothetical protein A4R26_05585 [Niastella populi]|uniref:Uncharacterized protein n=1 Tax=Niastella populi TaxID=550983 RepID=A0A1V9FE35_9BACT|nr:hypothetical protein A4R26_05585 [Niastella populi]